MFHCVHFECPSCDKEDLGNWAASSSKSSTDTLSAQSSSEAIQPTETATEAEELTLDSPEILD